VQPTPTPDYASTQVPPSETPAPAASVKPTKGDIPYGIPVPNKPGFVTSPYAPDQGYVDVRGFPAGHRSARPLHEQDLSRPLAGHALRFQAAPRGPHDRSRQRVDISAELGILFVVCGQPADWRFFSRPWMTFG
jgi:hypothetical protein